MKSMIKTKKQVSLLICVHEGSFDASDQEFAANVSSIPNLAGCFVSNNINVNVNQQKDRIFLYVITGKRNRKVTSVKWLCEAEGLMTNHMVKKMLIHHKVKLNN